jgi:hypothetical protein
MAGKAEDRKPGLIGDFLSSEVKLHRLRLLTGDCLLSLLPIPDHQRQPEDDEKASGTFDDSDVMDQKAIVEANGSIGFDELFVG